MFFCLLYLLHFTSGPLGTFFVFIMVLIESMMTRWKSCFAKFSYERVESSPVSLILNSLPDY